MIQKWLECLWELLYPSRGRCLGCGDEQGCDQPFLCDECRAMLKPSNVLAGRSEWRKRGIESIAFVYYYGRPVNGLVHALKFRGVRILAKPVAGIMAEDMVRLLKERFDRGYDFIVPVPLHPSRLAERGYNQAQLLAAEVSKLCGISIRTDIVQRTRKTRQQSKLSKKKRNQNLSNAFTARNDVSGKSILLLDDVITTGSTVCSCAEALKAAGAKEVCAVAFAGTHYCHNGIKHTYRKKKA